MSQLDTDKTVFMGLEGGGAGAELPPSIRPVTESPTSSPRRNQMYIAQQTSLESYTPGLNPIVNAAAGLLLIMVSLKEEGGLTEGELLVTQGGARPHAKMEAAFADIEHLRTRLESEIRAFENQALTSDVDNSQVLAARYLLCTAVDEAVTTSSVGASGEWSKLALLSTFHNETWGGEKFFQILERCMQQPARNLYLLELMYLLLSLGFEGKYRVLDRGPIAIETLRDKIYRQVRLLRGDPSHDLSKKVELGEKKSKIYAYIPVWLVVTVVAICLIVTFWGFSTTLSFRADPLLHKLTSTTEIKNGVQP